MKQGKSPALSRFQTDFHRLLTTLLQRDIEDPMLLGISLTRLDVTDAQGHAIAYVHSIIPVEQQECVKRLNRLSPHLLHQLRKALPKKRLPKLVFRWDDALDQAHSVMDTMDNLRS
ncbi:MAG TPA: ribosome-binding factor A [Ghiorsea sp.]|nr:ribosome-binding factor A [Ghiorsea sp.]HIP07464.1 ribosome-binding factor A [Mariprofundaceae bacterium]